MRIIVVNFESTTEDGNIRLTSHFIARQLEEYRPKIGEKVILTDGDQSVPATLRAHPSYGLVAEPDWSDRDRASESTPPRG